MVDIGFHDVHPAIYIWHVLAVIITGILIYISRFDPNIVWFYFLFIVFNFAGLFTYVFGWFSDLTEASSDWDHGADEPTEIGIWTVIGLVGLVIASLIIGVVTMQQLTFEVPILWVPMELSPFSLTDGAILAFVMALAGTWFAIVPGEEGMKTALSTTFKGYEHFGFDLPFCLHPARILVAVPSWAVLHVILGQNAWPFFFSVFIGGVLWDVVSAKCGTILVSYLIHGLFNSAILTVSFISVIGLTVLW